jgi:hypothetical protein
MADIRCPICDRPNDANAKRCWYCQAELHPHTPPGNDNSQEDWLSSLRDPSISPAADSNSDESEEIQGPSQNDTPEWLARIRTREQAEHQEDESQNQEQPTSASSHSSNADFPDWLTSIIPESGQSSENSAPSPVLGDEEGEPDAASPISDDNGDEWLKKLESWQPDDSYSSHLPHGESPTEQIASDSPQSANPGQTSSPDQPENSDHDEWAKQFDSWQPNNDFSQNQPKSDSPKQEPNVSEPQSAGSIDDNSDWLQAYKQDEKVNPTPLDQSPNSAAFLPDENTPDHSGAIAAQEAEQSSSQHDQDEGNWLSSFKGLQPDENIADQVLPAANENGQPKAPFDNNDVKAFLDEPTTDSGNPAEQPTPTIEPAALPAWIKALSPKQKSEPAASRHETLRPADSRGPLAGIEGALQGEELSQYYTRPQTFSGAVKISEGQQQRTQTLKNIVDQAHWVDEGLPDKTVSNDWVFRALVSIAMLVAVFIPLFFKGIPNVHPTLYPDEVVKTFNTVNSLPVDKPVLVAADFDGSLYGELNWSMQPLFSQLMARNIPVAYLSTNSVGASLFGQALSPLVAQNPAYSSTDYLIDLGYLPGGSTGMQSLVSDPLTAMPLDVNLHPAWTSAPLTNIKHLSDFGALVVITENADTARYWIEQVEPGLGTTPMLVVISAQSAPLLQPYYDSGQINGYISGLYSVAAYEALEKTPQNASSNLSSFQLTMILTALLIFIGGVVSLVLYRPRTQKQQGNQR